jgi:hypothetical protein
MPDALISHTNQFRRSGAGASRKGQAERDAPRRPIVKLVMAEILARQFHIEHAASPSIVNALFERAADEANARLSAQHPFAQPTSRRTFR